MNAILDTVWSRLTSVAVSTLVASSGWVVDPNASGIFQPHIDVREQMPQVPPVDDPLIRDLCRWWDGINGSGAAHTSCTNTAIFRLTASSVGEGVVKATECARATGESCILSHEAFTTVPGVFLYDHTTTKLGMRFLVAPRILRATGVVVSDGVYANTSLHRVRVSPHALIDGSVLELELFDSVEVEYFSHERRAMRVENVTGNDAFCVQIIPRSVGETCVDMFA